MSEHDNGQLEVSASTGLGKVSAVLRGQGMIGIMRLVVTAALTLLIYIQYEHKTESRLGDLQITNSLKEQTHAVRLLTCVMSIPEERREKEYSEPNSFCRRIVEKQ